MICPNCNDEMWANPSMTLDIPALYECGCGATVELIYSPPLEEAAPSPTVKQD